MPMKHADFVRVDVFAKKPFQGNPLAVFPDARGLSSRDMQALAREMNLSETTFALPPRNRSADARVRIFTPDAEIPYAGHPTIGTFFVLAREGRIPVGEGKTVARMEAKAGVLPVEIFSRKGSIYRVVTVQKKPVFGPEFRDVSLLADSLSLNVSDFDVRKAPPQLVSTGLPWLIAPVKSRKALERISVDTTAFAKVVRKLPKGVVDVYATAMDPVDPRATSHSRGFSLVAGGVVEDPATGSASGCLGAYLVRRQLVDERTQTRMVNEQGFEIGRPSNISVEVRGTGAKGIESVRVGGSVVEIMRGTATF
ncbi:TPA: PhzF family phenazine biosynthesis protein [Thermoplasmata archaeon]|nr:PhzF family phenazine biosynthesis protein [Thermoplasmata archaeon]